MEDFAETVADPALARSSASRSADVAFRRFRDAMWHRPRRSAGPGTPTGSWGPSSGPWNGSSTRAWWPRRTRLRHGPRVRWRLARSSSPSVRGTAASTHPAERHAGRGQVDVGRALPSPAPGCPGLRPGPDSRHDRRRSGGGRRGCPHPRLGHGDGTSPHGPRRRGATAGRRRCSCNASSRPRRRAAASWWSSCSRRAGPTPSAGVYARRLEQITLRERLPEVVCRADDVEAPAAATLAACPSSTWEVPACERPRCWRGSIDRVALPGGVPGHRR